jgi:glycerol-3-phosphate dehydrogenase
VQVIHAVRCEMARHLTDVVLRRAEMGTTGHPGAADARTAALLMAEELGWSAARIDQEIASLDAACAVPPPPPFSPSLRPAPAVTAPTR